MSGKGQKKKNNSSSVKPRSRTPPPQFDEEGLERELRRRERELEALRAIQDSVANSLELSEVLNRALDAAIAVSHMDAGEILLWDSDRQVLDITAWRGVSPEYVEGMYGLKSGESISGHVFKIGKPYVVEDITTEPRVTREISRRQPVLRAGVVFPLRVKDRVLGTLGIGVRSPRSFPKEEVRLLQTIADQIAVAIDNAHLFEAQQKQTRRLVHLTQSTLPVLSITQPEMLNRRIVESAKDLIKADLVALPMIQPDGRSFTYVEAIGENAELLKGQTMNLDAGGLCGWVVAHSKPLLVPDVKGDPRVVQDLADALGVRSALIVPLTRGEHTLGGLSAFRKRTSFTESDLLIFQIFANYATASLENSQLFQAHEDARQKLHSLVESIPGVVWEVDLTLNRITYVSPQVESLTGRPADYYLSGSSMWDHVHPEDMARAESALAAVQQTGFIPGAEVRIVHRDGRPIWIRAYGQLIRDASGQPVTLRGVVFDVTYEKQFEEERKRLERLRALGEIASGVAHDFNNALFAIVGYTELIAERMTDPDLLQDLSSLRRAASDASRIVRRMEAFYKTQVASLVALDLNEIITESLDITRPRWKIYPQVQGIHIEVVTRLNDLPAIQGDAAELREVFTNLIFNAVDAMPTGGTLTIESSSEGDRVVVSVRDTGVGMDEATRRRVFEAFYTTKGARGSGLGLSLCNSIIGRHGGTIHVESAPEAGSSFIVTLPVTQELAATPPPQEEAPAGRPLTLLAVDDEPTARDVLRSMLARLGHSTTLCETGEDAVHAFSRGRFDAVITDLGMPAPNGFEVARRIREVSPDTPVILLTGWGEMLAPELLEQSCISYLLKKPVMLTRLRTILTDIASDQTPKR
ncbi:MAG: GAF domain-containing protein [bacterium]